MKYESVQKLEARNLKIIWNFYMLLFVSIHLGFVMFFVRPQVYPMESIVITLGGLSVGPSAHQSLNTSETAHWFL